MTQPASKRLVTEGSLATGPAAAILSASTAAQVVELGSFPVWDDFAGRPNGKPTLTRSGHPYVYSESPNAGADLRVASGQMVHAPVLTGSAINNDAGYATVELDDGDVTVFRGRFKFPANDSRTLSGEIAMVVWQTDKVNGQPIPNSGCHFTIQATECTYGLWDNALGANNALVTNLAGGKHTFLIPLARNVEHTVTIFIDKATSSAAVLLPNGAVLNVSDPRIAAYAGPHACIEIYEFRADLQVPAVFTGWGAAGERTDLTNRGLAPTHADVAKAAAATPGAGSVVIYDAGVDGNVALTGSPQEVGRARYVVPADARYAEVRAQVWCDIAAGDTLVFYAYRADIGGPPELGIENSPAARHERLSFDKTIDMDGLHPGDTVDIIFALSGSSTSTFKNYAAHLRTLHLSVRPASILSLV